MEIKAGQRVRQGQKTGRAVSDQFNRWTDGRPAVEVKWDNGRTSTVLVKAIRPA